MSEILLDIEGLHVRFGAAHAVRGTALRVRAGETHCLVGESGCGKSVSALAVMNLLARGARREAARLDFMGRSLLGLSETEMSRLRGDAMAMIFQEPMTSLNPAYTVGSQMAEVYTRHRGGGRAAALERAAGLLAKVGITAPGMRLAQYPHQLSGGLRQRVMIAMALMCEPKLLIADEPTTALDVTVQAQILRLLLELQRELGLAVLLITHDLGIVARMAHRVSVMYAGEVVESGTAEAVFAAPTHPYTRALLAASPNPARRGVKTQRLEGSAKSPIDPDPQICRFAGRCPIEIDRCRRTSPPLLPTTAGHLVACHRAHMAEFAVQKEREIGANP